MDPLATLGTRLRWARQQTGRTTADLAAQAGIRAATLSDLERGQGDVLASTLLRLAPVLGVPAAWLLTGGLGYVQGCGELSETEYVACRAFVALLREHLPRDFPHPA